MNAIKFYIEAKQHVLNLGYAQEIEWQESQMPEKITESEFLKEAAWVIYCSGFREATVKQYFNFLSLCFCDWESAEEIVINKDRCTAAAMRVMRNRRKHEAIVNVASRILSCGFESFMKSVFDAPINTLQQLPFIGPVTVLHLAKNLGFDVAKPDRHLLRLYDKLGFSSVKEMCDGLALESGDSVKVVDLILWRFLERQGTTASIINNS